MSLVQSSLDWITATGTWGGQTVIDDDTRARLRPLVGRAWEKLDAAELLELHVGFGESSRLSLEAVEVLRGAMNELPETARTWLAPQARALDDAAALATSASTATEQLRAHRALERSALDLLRRFEAFSAPPSRLRLTGALRTFTILACVFTVGLLVHKLVKRPLPLTANATGYAEASHEPWRAVDRRIDTEWWLPDGGLGSIEVDVTPARDVKSISLMNCRNLPTLDRAARDYRIELLSAGSVVATIDDFFGAPSDKPTWREHAVSGRRVDKVRVTLKTYFGRGGGLAEIEVR